MDLLYKELDFPKVPQYLQEMCFEKIKGDPFLILGKPELFSQGQCAFKSYNIPLELNEWLKANGLHSDRVSIQVSTNGTRLFPHTDWGNDNISSRDWAINYLLTPSGPITSWYNTGQVVKSVNIPSNVWHQISTSVIHGVTNIIGDRISISLSFSGSRPPFE